MPLSVGLYYILTGHVYVKLTSIILADMDMKRAENTRNASEIMQSISFFAAPSARWDLVADVRPILLSVCTLPSLRNHQGLAQPIRKQFFCYRCLVCMADRSILSCVGEIFSSVGLYYVLTSEVRPMPPCVCRLTATTLTDTDVKWAENTRNDELLLPRPWCRTSAFLLLHLLGEILRPTSDRFF